MHAHTAQGAARERMICTHCVSIAAKGFQQMGGDDMEAGALGAGRQMAQHHFHPELKVARLQHVAWGQAMNKIPCNGLPRARLKSQVCHSQERHDRRPGRQHGGDPGVGEM